MSRTPISVVVIIIIIILGLLLSLSGATFTLQGLGIVGPPSSFMFRNSQWIYDGSAALVAGIITLLGGVFLWVRRPK